MGGWKSCVRIVAVGSIMAATGCSDAPSFREDLEDRLRASVCRDACGCGGDTCSSWASAEAERISDLLGRYDFTFDGACFAARLEAHEAAECRPRSWAHARTCGVTCTLLYGEQELGEPCDTDESYSTCRRGLVCRPTGCADPCDRSAVGSPCPNGSCPYPTQCDTSTDTCQALPGEGEACLGGLACEDGLFCIEDVCRGPGEFGATCTGHEQCISNHCPAGFCVNAPLEGESCTGQVACASGLRCEDEVCVAEMQPVDTCPCPQGQLCENGRCRLAEVSQCGADFLVE
ncbi:MAG: hypothetical protein ACE37F_21000 [Nannocystaceae bacterium]|nr:hypothetical protein [bacterium]